MVRHLKAFIAIALIGATAIQAAPLTTAPENRQDQAIQLNFPENVDLKVFIQYVSERLGLNILYDEQTVNQKITIKAPSPIPKDSLLGLLQSVLQAKGLMLVDAEQPEWKRIVQSSALSATARPTTRPLSLPSTSQPVAVTQVFTLSRADPAKAEQVIKPFLTQPGGSSIALPDLHLLIITDYSTNVLRLSELVRLVDQPQRPVETRFITPRNGDAQDLSQQVSALLAARGRAEGSTTPSPVEITVEPRTNQVVLIGTEEAVKAATELLQSIDVPLGVTTRTYQFQYVSPDRIDRLVKELIGANEVKRVYSSTVDTESNLLIATTTDAIHQRIANLKQQLDVAGTTQERSPIRFYKLDNTTATDVLQTIQAIEGDEGTPSVNVEGLGGSSSNSSSYSSIGNASQIQLAPPPLSTGTIGQSIGGTGPTSMPSSYGRETVRSKDATITADPNTNTIIVVAKPEAQHIYEELIQTLDKRRPQVLIECTIVTLDTSKNFSFGVEISGRGGGGNTDIVNFSSFGLSTVGTGTGSSPSPSTGTGSNSNLGQLTLNPGIGFNGTLIQSDIAQVVIRALLSTGRAEVVSAPKLLVNDNTTGELSSVQEDPFTSVNASNTIATTSFAGYASAGTTISVTPHISDADFLQLEYTIALNSFTGDASSASTPPPRQTNQLQSKVTIPDGSTIIVGGLNRKNYSHTVDAVPLLGQIPVLGSLFSNRSDTSSTSTLFVFIRPVVLRDDKFADLKFFSERSAQAAKLQPDYPKSEPIATE